MTIEFHTVNLDVKAIKLRLEVNQYDFSDALGLSLKTIKIWEQGRRNPTGLARKVFKLIDSGLGFIIEQTKLKIDKC
jgi:DNA-binding transcriptional regulator YiaG